GRLVAGAARCPNIWRMTRGTRTFSLALALALTAPAALAQGAPGGDPMPAPADLPVTRVVLFTSGVAYFEHEGTVVGDRAFELSVPPSEMDDMLQTLVLQDLDGGTIEPVTYDSREPLGRILAGYSIDLSGAPTLAQILGQHRREVVHLEASRPLTGAIVSVQRVEAPEEGPRTLRTLATPLPLHRRHRLRRARRSAGGGAPHLPHARHVRRPDARRPRRGHQRQARRPRAPGRARRGPRGRRAPPRRRGHHAAPVVLGRWRPARA